MRAECRSPVMTRLLLGGIFLAALPAVGRADTSGDDLQQLKSSLQKEIAALKQQQTQLHLKLLGLDRKNEVLDHQLKSLRAAGVAPGATASSPRADAPRSGEQQDTEVAQTSGPAAATGGNGDASAGSAESQSAPISGPSSKEQEARRVLETAPTLSNTGGVLTPRGQFVIAPSFEYDYWSQNQLGVNGFQIIPGITFGNIFVNRVEQNIGTAAVTIRAGITDRLEANVKIPYVVNYGSTNSLIPLTDQVQNLGVNASNANLGDIQFGASYQINAGQNGWPIFVGNFLFKTITGVSPFDVPIVTSNDPDPYGKYFQGAPKKLATGTGFYSLEPSLTVLYPTAPGVLFANLLFIENLGRTVNIQSTSGGPPTPTKLTPGRALALTFGIGFALNDRTSLTLSYQQEHVFTAYANGQAIKGSPYSFGTFNFGLGYELSQSTRLNVSVGVGAGPNAPVAKILMEVPYRFSL